MDAEMDNNPVFFESEPGGADGAAAAAERPTARSLKSLPSVRNLPPAAAEEKLNGAATEIQKVRRCLSTWKTPWLAFLTGFSPSVSHFSLSLLRCT